MHHPDQQQLESSHLYLIPCKRGLANYQATNCLIINSSATNSEVEYPHTDGLGIYVAFQYFLYKALSINSFKRIIYKHLETPKNSLKVISISLASKLNNRLMILFWYKQFQRFGLGLKMKLLTLRQKQNLESLVFLEKNLRLSCKGIYGHCNSNGKILSLWIRVFF